jgi:hypothetical protein
VVDEAGNPYVEHRVEQAWKHYSLELGAGSNGEVRWTDRNGYVSFPERTLRANLLWRVAIPIFSSVMTLAHGSTGVSSTVFTTGPQGYGSAKYVSGKPPPEQLVLPRETEELQQGLHQSR